MDRFISLVIFLGYKLTWCNSRRVGIPAVLGWVPLNLTSLKRQAGAKIAFFQFCTASARGYPPDVSRTVSTYCGPSIRFFEFPWQHRYDTTPGVGEMGLWTLEGCYESYLIYGDERSITQVRSLQTGELRMRLRCASTRGKYFDRRVRTSDCGTVELRFAQMSGSYQIRNFWTN